MGLFEKLRISHKKNKTLRDVIVVDDDDNNVSENVTHDSDGEQQLVAKVNDADSSGNAGAGHQDAPSISVDYTDIGEEDQLFVNRGSAEESRDTVQEFGERHGGGVRGDNALVADHDLEICHSNDGEDESLDTRSMISDGVSLSEADGVAMDLNALAALELEDASAKKPSETSRRHLVKKYNDVAVRFMESKDFDHSLGMLEKAESLLNTLDASKEECPQNRENTSMLTRSRLRSMTYNNFGCLYRRMLLPQKALEYLEKALVIEEMSNNVNECASTHLNLSASHSVLHNDLQALRHGEKSIILIQGQLWPGKSFQEGLAKLVIMLHSNEENMEAWKAQAMKDAHVLAMAYHNVGTQNERLGRVKEAQVSFSRACSIGMKVLGPRSVTTAALIRGNKLFQQRLRDNQNNSLLSTAKQAGTGMTRSKSLSNIKMRQSDPSSLHRSTLGGKGSKSSVSLSGKSSGKKTKSSRGTRPFNR